MVVLHGADLSSRKLIKLLGGSKDGQIRGPRSPGATASRRSHRCGAKTKMAELYLGLAGQITRGTTLLVQTGFGSVDFCEFG